MPIPVIVEPREAFEFALDVPISPYVPYATQTPTEWAASGLPSGLACDEDTGTISGTPDTAGEYTITLIATNGSGASAPLIFGASVHEIPNTDDGLVEINANLQTGIVWNESVTTGAILYAKNGTKLPVALGLERGGTLRALTLTNVKVVLRDDYPDTRTGDESPEVVLFDDEPGAPLDPVNPRYRLTLDFSGSNAAAVVAMTNAHATDGVDGLGVNSELLALCDITLTHDVEDIAGTTSVPRTLRTFAVHIARTIATP